jgi:NAD(P)-dependent dehydrogenase (short-subunit alcohol dehydrogenase family)
MNVLITGTTSGIGADIRNLLTSDSNNFIVCGNRGGDSEIKLDMSSQQSIVDFVERHWEQNLKGHKFDTIILNAGTKATRKRVVWNGKQLNMCRVVNLLANEYLLNKLAERDLIDSKAKIVFITSVTHWNAVDNPIVKTETGDDPDDADWANQQYPNTKLGLFFLGKKMKKANPDYDIILINPGMVATKIFGDKDADGLIPSTIRYVREFLSMTPKESAEYIVESIMSPCKDKTKDFRYFTPYDSHPFFGLCEKTQMLQDVFGRRLLRRLDRDTDNFSSRVFDERVAKNYENYLGI